MFLKIKLVPLEGVHQRSRHCCRRWNHLAIAFLFVSSLFASIACNPSESVLLLSSCSRHPILPTSKQKARRKPPRYRLQRTCMTKGSDDCYTQTSNNTTRPRLLQAGKPLISTEEYYNVRSSGILLCKTCRFESVEIGGLDTSAWLRRCMGRCEIYPSGSRSGHPLSWPTTLVGS